MRQIRNIAFVVMCMAFVFSYARTAEAMSCGTWDVSFFDDCYPDNATTFENWVDDSCWYYCGAQGVACVDSWVWDNPCVGVCYCMPAN
jgi:hypothetical protein